MTERERAEQQIREVLATETSAIPLSDKLFHPDGLFNQLARTEEERRIVAQSSLFQQAQRRLTELQQSEAAKFTRAVTQAQADMPERGYVLKLERSESV
jgi:hypothetical protein